MPISLQVLYLLEMCKGYIVLAYSNYTWFIGIRSVGYDNHFIPRQYDSFSNLTMVVFCHCPVVLWTNPFFIVKSPFSCAHMHISFHMLKKKRLCLKIEGENGKTTIPCLKHEGKTINSKGKNHQFPWVLLIFPHEKSNFSGHRRP